MLIMVSCPSCGNKIGEYDMAIKAMKKKYFEENQDKLNKYDDNATELNHTTIINSQFSSQFSMAEILDELKINNVCCRMRLICFAEFYD